MGGQLHNEIEKTMKHNTIRPSVRGDVDYIAPLLRQEDLNEIKASGAYTALEVLEHGFEMSKPCLTLCTPAHGEPVGMLGVVPVTNFYGRVWMLCTDVLTQYPIHVLRHSREWVDKLNTIYPILGNKVDLSNTVHVKWLKWCGFIFTHKYCHNGIVFQFFMRGGKPYV